MKHRRISLAELMGVLAIIAFDGAALRPMYLSETVNADYALGALPMGGILACGLFLIVGSLSRNGDSGPFLLGFELFGTLATVAFLFTCAVLPEQVDRWVDAVVDPLPGALSPIPYSVLIEKSCLATAFTLSELIVAGVGGWIFQELGVRIVITRPHNTSTVPAASSSGENAGQTSRAVD